MSCKNSWAQAEKGDRLSCSGNAGSVWSASASTVALLALEISKWGYNTINIYFSKNTILCGIISSSPCHTKLFAQTLSVRGKERDFFVVVIFNWDQGSSLACHVALWTGVLVKQGLQRTGNKQLEEGGCLNQDREFKKSVFVKLRCKFKPCYSP